VNSLRKKTPWRREKKSDGEEDENQNQKKENRYEKKDRSKDVRGGSMVCNVKKRGGGEKMRPIKTPTGNKVPF